MKSSQYPKRIVTGYPLDLLLNRECHLSRYDVLRNNKKAPLHEKDGGLVLPSIDPDYINDEDYSPGTGNIVIRGKPGTGKSTLALQLAVAATYDTNNCNSIYISMEESERNIKSKAGTFLWEDKIELIDSLGDVSSDREPSSQDVYNRLVSLSKTKKVFVPSMSPRSVLLPDRPVHELFWDRYRQLELLLSAAYDLNKNILERNEDTSVRPIGMVCVDSLSVFGDLPLTREELYKIFDLFRRYRMIGVFTAEEPGKGTNGGNQDIDYLADVVIHLHSGEDNGYAMKYIEITKSRYQNELHGRHPFKIRVPTGVRKKPVRVLDEEFAALKIFPSLHHVVLATGGLGDSDSQTKLKHLNSQEFDIGVTGLKELLPPNFKKRSVVTIKGPRGAFKTQMARSFLMAGIRHRNGKYPRDRHVLLINLRGVQSINIDDKSTKDRWILDKEFGEKEFKWNRSGFKLSHTENTQEESNKTHAQKQISATYEKYSRRITELTFRSGALLAEEFIEEVRQIMSRYENKKEHLIVFVGNKRKPAEFVKKRMDIKKRHRVRKNRKTREQKASIRHPICITRNQRISRVVLDDVSLIGTSYPFLRNSDTGADLFLPTFVHVMRNYGVDLVMTASTGELQEIRDIVDRAVSLSDTVLDVQFCDVFGKQYVIVLGDGLTAEGSVQSANRELVPGTVQVHKNYFEVVQDKLQGLVGFDSGSVHRPGLKIYVASQGHLLEKYNDEIEHMISALVANNPVYADKPRTAVVQRFSNDLAETIHDSLSILEGKPLDQTVVYGIDEFGHPVAKDDSISERFEKFDFPNIGYEKGFLSPAKEKPDPLLEYMIPYYGNVLLLAYRKDVVDKIDGLQGRVKELRKWTEMQQILLDVEQEICPPMEQKFYYEDASGETLACALLDALFCCHKEKKGEPGQEQYEDLAYWIENLIEKLKEKKSLTETEETAEIMEALLADTSKSEVYALHEILLKKKVEKNGQDSSGRMNDQKPDVKSESKPPKPPLSVFYLCWYSQLREWMAADEEGELARNIGVIPLPGGGFRGDWFLGVVKGSVSRSLGEQVIKSLCSAKEDYKRFARGIGLPTREAFYHKEQDKEKMTKDDDKIVGHFYAWPNSKPSEGSTEGGYLLSEMYDNIYKSANKRSSIPDYQQVRPLLWTICRQLKNHKKTSDVNDVDTVWKIVKRISNQVKVLKGAKRE